MIYSFEGVNELWVNYMHDLTEDISVYTKWDVLFLYRFKGLLYSFYNIS